MRTPLRRGIFNVETAWYDSREDRDGDEPQVPNSQLRLLAGYEQELVRNLNAGTQIHVERTLVGGNLFGGRHDHSFFGQLEDNSNAWGRIRYHY